MSKTIKLSAIFTATVLVAGLIGVSFSDEAFAKKPETKKVLVQVKDAEGNPVKNARCTDNFPPGPENWFVGNDGGVVQFDVPTDQETIALLVCIDDIPPNANFVLGNVELKDNGTTVVQATLNSIP